MTLFFTLPTAGGTVPGELPFGDSDVDDRRTPRLFFERLHRERRFTIDAAASDDNHLLPAYWTREQNGLAQPWEGHRVWANPPYSDLDPWLVKAWAEMLDGECYSVTMLLPSNRTDQPFWHSRVEPYRDGAPVRGVRLAARFLPGRMRFSWPDRSTRPTRGLRPRFGNVLLTWDRVR